jgi:hypothetical protein
MKMEQNPRFGPPKWNVPAMLCRAKEIRPEHGVTDDGTGRGALHD